MQTKLPLAGRPGAGRVGLGAGAICLVQGCFDRSVVPLVTWVFSKLPGNLADTLDAQLSRGEHVCARTWVLPSVANLAAECCLFSRVCWDLGGFCCLNFSLVSQALLQLLLQVTDNFKELPTKGL